MKVRNINNISQSSCKCGSWLKHWRNFSHQTATICRVAGCSRTDLSGAHVQKATGHDGSWYIVPLCTAHNRAYGSNELVSGTKLVSANKRLTCMR